MAKHVHVTRETDSGRNTGFRDADRNRSMSRPEFVQEIERGHYPDYHVRKIDGVKTPVSNPDGRKGNNLG